MSVNLVSTSGTSGGGVNFNNNITDILSDEIIFNNTNIVGGQCLIVNGSKLLRSIAYGTSSTANTLVIRDSNGKIINNIINSENLEVFPTSDGNVFIVKNSLGVALFTINTTTLNADIAGSLNVISQIIKGDGNVLDIKNSANLSLFQVNTTTKTINCLDDSQIRMPQNNKAFLTSNFNTLNGFGMNGNFLSYFDNSGVPRFQFSNKDWLPVTNIASRIGNSSLRMSTISCANIDTSFNNVQIQAYRPTTTATDLIMNLKSNVGTSGNAIFTIDSAGNVLNTNGSYGMLSDSTLKKNISPVTIGYYKDQFMAIKLKKFNWNYQADTDPKYLGFISQEVGMISPGLCSNVNIMDDVPDPNDPGSTIQTIINTKMTVKTSIINLMMFDVVQNLQNIVDAQQIQINDLLNRVTILETG